MRSILRAVLPSTIWTAFLGSLCLHGVALGVFWNWQPKPGDPLATTKPMQVRLIRQPKPKIARVPEPVKPPPEPPPEAPPPPEPTPPPPPPKRAKPELPPPVKDKRPTVRWRRPELPEADEPTVVAHRPEAEPPEPELTKPPTLVPLAELPKPQLPEPTPPKPPERPLPKPEQKQTLMAKELDRYWQRLRSRDLDVQRARTVWNSTRTYTEANAGHIVATFGETTITRKQVEDMHERVYGVKLKDLDLTPEQARRQIESLVGGLLLPEIEVAEAEQRGYATKPGIHMDKLYGVMVTSDEVQEHYNKNKDLYQGRSLAEVWSKIQDDLVGIRLAEAKQKLEDNLKELREAANVVEHYEVFDQPDAPDEAVLFTIGKQPYTMAQWREEMATLKTPPEGRDACEKYARELIDRILLLSSTDGIQDEALRTRYERQRRENLVRLLRDEEVTSKIQMTDEEREQYYQKMKDNLIVLGGLEVGWIKMRFEPGPEGAAAAKTRLEQIRQEIETTKDFDAIAETCSKDADTFQVKKRARFSLSPPVFLDDGLPQEVRALPKGATSAPLLYANDGVGYVFHVQDRHERRTMERDEAAPFVEGQLWDDKYAERSEEFDRELVAGADIQYNEATVADMVSKATGHRMVDAGAPVQNVANSEGAGE